MVKLAWTSGEKKVLVLTALSALVAVALNLVSLYVSPAVLGAVERRVPVLELAATIVGFTLARMFLGALTSYLEMNKRYLGRLGLRLELVAKLNQKAATTSYPNLTDDGFRKLYADAIQCTNRNAAAGEAIWETLDNLLRDLLGFALYVILLMNVDPLLILVTLVTAAIGYYVTNRLNGYGYRHREEKAELENQMQYLESQSKNAGAAKDIRIFGLRTWLEELHQKALDAYTAFHEKAETVYLWGRVTDLVLAFLRNGLAYAYLIALVVEGRLTVAEFLLYFSAVEGFTQWVTGILGGFSTLRKQSLDLCSVRDVLEYPEPFRFETGKPLTAQPEKAYEIRLEDVSFRYPGAEQDTLSHIHLTLHPGEKLAVVGLNGAGKTTLIKLISGFLDPTEGRVLLDGVDIRTYNRADYYRKFSAVFQDFSLLAGSIAANVAQSEDSIDMERVKSCVEKAGLTRKIESLTDGYQTKLNREVYEEAILLSGGETQRLMLARALYKNAPIILLDEPTAALDPIAEEDMYRKYEEMTAGRSSIYISHRLASTRFCDRILLIDGGVIREEGTHQQLLDLGGKYAELFAVQSKYYQEGEDSRG